MEMKETLMKFGGTVKTSAEKFAKGAVDSSKKMAEKVKIKRAISEAESKLNAAYIEIGKKYEELYANQGDAEFAEMLANIADARAKIAAARAELAAVDSAVVCSGCGKYVQEDQKFCPHCGLKQEPPAPEVKEDASVEAVDEAVETVEAEIVEETTAE